MIMETFPEEPQMALLVAANESDLLMVQSRERYQEDKPHWGVKKGERERSFCIFQIHDPAHGDRAEKLGLDYKNSIKDCIKMARLIYEDSGFHPWTEYKRLLAMR